MIEYTEEEQEIIREFLRDRAVQTGAFWSDERVASIREKIKRHFIALQQRRCCYCRRDLQTEHARMWDAEHVVSRASHPHFMFEYRNLAVACVDCNQAKGETSTLMRPRRRYPRGGDEFLIVQPHFDDYGRHILRDGDVYLPRTDKGIFTVTACKLLRFVRDALQLAGEVLDERYEQAADLVFVETPNRLQREAAADGIIAAIERLTVERNP